MSLGGGIRSSIYSVSTPVLLSPKQCLMVCDNSIGKIIFQLDYLLRNGCHLDSIVLLKIMVVKINMKTRKFSNFILDNTDNTRIIIDLK